MYIKITILYQTWEKEATYVSGYRNNGIHLILYQEENSRTIALGSIKNYWVDRSWRW